MNYPFTHEITVGGAIVAEIEGTLVIEADPDSRTDDGHPDWTVSHVMLNGFVRGDGVRRTEVVLPDTHADHDAILAGALNRYRREIDAAWAEHCLDFQVDARDRARALQHSAHASA